MRNFIAVVILIMSIVVAAYVGGWLLFIKPLLAAAAAYDTGVLTGTIIVKTIIKCVCASFAAGVISTIGFLISGAVHK